MSEKLEICPACGALPCDWTENPFATPANGEQVERVAKAMYDATHAGLRNCYAWEDAWEDHQEHHRDRYYKEARAAIAAMDPTPTQDARERVKVIEEAARPIVAKLAHSEASFARYRAAHPDEQDVNGDDGVCISVADLRALRTALGNQEERL